MVGLYVYACPPRGKENYTHPRRLIQVKTEKEQIDEMINEGLGGGTIDDEKDKKQIENPLSKKKHQPIKKENSMTTNLEDAKKLGKEMEHMKTNQQIEEEGLTPDPIQK